MLFMKRKLLFILSLFLIFSIFSFGENFPEKAKNINGFVPKGWKTVLSAKGDLNNDKLEDVAIIIEKTDKANIVKNENLGSEYLNLNPRIFLVLFKQKMEAIFWQARMTKVLSKAKEIRKVQLLWIL